MLWKRITHAFLLGAGMSVVGVGCSAVNAIVSSSAGHSASHTSPQRLVAIGRVFENQGYLNRATAMYRQALKADPGNSIAQQRMDFIAGINSGKTFSPTERQSHQAIAIADSIQNRSRKATAPAKQSLKSALAADGLKASLQPAVATVEPTTKTVVAQVSHDLPEVNVETEVDPAFDDDSGWVNVVDTGWELAEIEDTALLPQAEMTVSPSKRVDDQAEEEAAIVETVAFDKSDELASGKVLISNASEWKATTRPTEPAVASTIVTLDEIAACMENPVANTATLLQGLTYGEDDGVKALSATLLTECALGDNGIDSALAVASKSQSELLQLSSLDALVQRGGISERGVDSLVSLLACSNSEIRIQAAASLRNCANTDWSARCITGLSQMLGQPEPQVVAVAASTLGDFGQQAAEHLGVLQQLAQSTDAVIAEAASTAISRIQDTTQPLNSVPLSLDIDSAAEYLPVVE